MNQLAFKLPAWSGKRRNAELPEMISSAGVSSSDAELLPPLQRLRQLALLLVPNPKQRLHLGARVSAADPDVAADDLHADRNSREFFARPHFRDGVLVAFTRTKSGELAAMRLKSYGVEAIDFPTCFSR
jgi:hypothetical protein